MHNILNLPADRRRPQRRLGMPRNGARILFFTGVRYCRDEPVGDDVSGGAFHVVQGSPSDRMFDVAAH